MRVKVLLLTAAILIAWAAPALAQEPVEQPEPREKLTQAEEIERLVGELGSDDWSVREAATKRLTAIGLPAAERVEKLLESDDMELRIRAKKILASLHYVSKIDREKIEKEIDLCLWGAEAKPADDETKKLIEELSSDDWQVREDAAKKLVEKGPGALREVAKLLDTDDPDLKDRVERIVKEIKEKAKEKLEEQLKKSIEALKPVKSAPYYLTETLTTKGEKPRETIISKVLTGILDLKSDIDGDGNVIIQRAGGGARTIRIQVINGKTRKWVNGEEVTGLGKNPTPEKVLAVIAADEKKDADLRLRAIKALEARKATDAVSSLMKLLGKSKDELQLETARVLRKLTGQEFGPTEESAPEETEKALEEWNKWWEENKKNEKYRFSDEPDNEDTGSVIQLGPARKQLEEARKKMQEAMKKATGELEKKPEKAEKEQEKTEPEKEEKKEEPKKEDDGGEKKSRDF